MTTTPTDTAHACHNCSNPATSQWQRQATPDETEQHWTAVEQNIRANNSGNPDVDYVADRTDTVTKSVFGCEQHDLSPAPVDDTPEARAAATQAGLERRALIHASDCGGHGACQCGETADA